MKGTKISCRARAATFGAAALILAIAGSPRIAGAVQSTCTGAFDLQYTSGPSFPQPVPPGNAGDDQLTVQLTLGAQSIQNATTLTVADVRFDLDCSDAFPAPPCTDQGDIIEYQGDGTILSDCQVGGNPVSWASTAVGTNEIKFVPTPHIPIPANTVMFCHLSFGIKVANLPSAPPNTSGTTKEIAYYGPQTTCNNGLTAGNFGTGQIFFCPVCNDSNVCTTDTCNSDADTAQTACIFTPIPPCNDNDGCTVDTCDPVQGCVFTLPAGETCDSTPPGT